MSASNPFLMASYIVTFSFLWLNIPARKDNPLTEEWRSVFHSLISRELTFYLSPALDVIHAVDFAVWQQSCTYATHTAAVMLQQQVWWGNVCNYTNYSITSSCGWIIACWVIQVWKSFIYSNKCQKMQWCVIFNLENCTNMGMRCDQTLFMSFWVLPYNLCASNPTRLTKNSFINVMIYIVKWLNIHRLTNIIVPPFGDLKLQLNSSRQMWWNLTVQMRVQKNTTESLRN